MGECGIRARLGRESSCGKKMAERCVGSRELPYKKGKYSVSIIKLRSRGLCIMGHSIKDLQK